MHDAIDEIDEKHCYRYSEAHTESATFNIDGFKSSVNAEFAKWIIYQPRKSTSRYTVPAIKS